MYDWIYENRTNTLHQMTHMHFDFTTPRRPEIDENKKKEGEEQEKGDKREEGKKRTGIPFNFYIVYSSEKKKRLSRARVL